MFTPQDIDKMMDLARETCNEAPFDMPPEVKEATVGLMVGMYIKGFKDCLKSQRVAVNLMMEQMEQSHEYFDKLYNVKNE